MDKMACLYDSGAVLPSLRTLNNLKKIARCPSNVAIIGRDLHLLNLKRVIDYLRAQGKTVVLVDIDLVGGMKYDVWGVRFLAKNAQADGIISTHTESILAAKKEGMITILKGFIHDELSIVSVKKNYLTSRPDIVNLLPGIAAAERMDRLDDLGDFPVHLSGILPPRYEEIGLLLNGRVKGFHSGDPDLWNAGLSVPQTDACLDISRKISLDRV